jgi:hypothetical protein
MCVLRGTKLIFFKCDLGDFMVFLGPRAIAELMPKIGVALHAFRAALTKLT